MAGAEHSLTFLFSGKLASRLPQAFNLGEGSLEDFGRKLNERVFKAGLTCALQHPFCWEKSCDEAWSSAIRPLLFLLLSVAPRSQARCPRSGWGLRLLRFLFVPLYGSVHALLLPRASHEHGRLPSVGLDPRYGVC